MPAEDYIMHNGNQYIRLDKCEEIFNGLFAEKSSAVYTEVGKDIIAQVAAVYLSTLSKDFGFGKERIQRVYDSTTAIFKMMNDKPFNKKFDPDDCIKYIKDKFGIDVYNQ